MAGLQQVIKMYGEKCYYCDSWAETVDHYDPLSLGGSNSMDNLRPSCIVDNNLKGNMRPVDWWAYMQTTEYRDRRELLLVKFGNKRPNYSRVRRSRRNRRSGKPLVDSHVRNADIDRIKRILRADEERKLQQIATQQKKTRKISEAARRDRDRKAG